MKKAQVLLLFIFILYGLSGCYTSTFNRLGDQDYLIYESDTKSVRLEIGMKTDNVGRLYILEDEVIQIFVIRYTIIQENIDVFISPPELEDSIFKLDVSFKNINFFKKDYDVMNLKEQKKVGTNNSKHEIFNEFDVVLKRLYDEDPNPLNYFYNKWQTEDGTIVFINDDLNYYYGNSILGTLNEENVWISFLNESFIIWSKIDLNMKLSGKVVFDGLDIVLEPFEWYTDYQNTITLFFMEITNA